MGLVGINGTVGVMGSVGMIGTVGVMGAVGAIGSIGDVVGGCGHDGILGEELLSGCADGVSGMLGIVGNGLVGMGTVGISEAPVCRLCNWFSCIL